MKYKLFRVNSCQWLPGLLALAVGLLAPPPVLAQSTDCSVLGQNTFVRSTMQDIYFWYREMPDLNPALFDSPEDYLDAVRYRPLDSSFSYISSQAADDAFFSESQFIGIGLSTKVLGPDELRLSDVFPDSPASEAGLQRGHQLLAINGTPVADLIARGEVSSAFGPSQVGVTVHVRYRDLQGREGEAQMTKRPVTIPTVALTQVYDIGGHKVGYLVLKNFVQPTTAALNAAFARLAEQGVTELILDVRYNGGGLVSVAQHLGGLIGGMRTSTQVFANFFHNDKNTHRNQVLRFPDPPNALSLTRLVVITTRASASASELIINALRPFTKVAVVGDRTFGKPVGQYGFRFCGKVLYPVSFTLRNAANEGDFFDGFSPDCPAPDDLGRAFGDIEEGSLAEALRYLETGTCSATAAARAKAMALPRGVRAPHTENGWQQLVGAY